MVEDVEQALRAEVDPKKGAILERFFKAGPGEYAEGDQFLGVKVPAQRTIAKLYYKSIMFKDLVRLLQSPWHEERLTAVFMLVLKFQKGNDATKLAVFDLYMSNTKYVNNWDLVDSSAEFIVGPWIENNPYKMKILTKLAKADLLWERRIAMLSTFHYIKQGKTDEAFKVIDILLHDSHDLIQKAVGWMLREVGKRADRQQLLTFLDTHAHNMPRTTLRYAIEHLSPEQKQHYMHLKNR